MENFNEKVLIAEGIGELNLRFDGDCWLEFLKSLKISQTYS
jgi:hypothetical protein